MANDIKAQVKMMDKLSASMKRVTETMKSVQKTTDSYCLSLKKLSAIQIKVSKGTRSISSSINAVGKQTKRVFSDITSSANKAISSLNNVRKKATDVSSGGSSPALRTSSSFGLAKGIKKVFSRNQVKPKGKGKSAAQSIKNGAKKLSSVGAYDVAKEALRLSSEAEQARIPIQAMLGDEEKAKTLMADLTQFANKTPFELPQVMDSAKEMLALKFAADSVIPTLTAVGNASAGLGLGKEGNEKIIDSLLEMKASQKVSAEDMNQLTRIGISGWEMLADSMHATKDEVIQLAEEGLIPADKAIQSLVTGMNNQFPNMMNAQGKSLLGLWSMIKETFNNNILKRFGDGISSAVKPRFEQLTMWITNNGVTIELWGAHLQAMAYTASDTIARTFEGAFTYIKTRFLDNPEFMNIKNISGKVEYIIKDLKKTYDEWFSAGGNTQIEEMARDITNFLGQSVGTLTQPLIEAGIKLGKSAGQGAISGLNEMIKDHPILSAAAVAAATPGGPTAKAIAAGGTLLYGTTQKIGEEIAGKPISADEMVKRGIANPMYREGGWFPQAPRMPKGIRNFYDGVGLTKVFGLEDKMKAADKVDAQKPPKNAGGLSRVPYNGYHTILHKDEEVLTKSEADTRREGRNSGGANVSVTGNTFIVRKESDIDAIAEALAARLNGLGTVMAY